MQTLKGEIIALSRSGNMVNHMTPEDEAVDSLFPLNLPLFQLVISPALSLLTIIPVSLFGWGWFRLPPSPTPYFPSFHHPLRYFPQQYRGWDVASVNVGYTFIINWISFAIQSSEKQILIVRWTSVLLKLNFAVGIIYVFGKQMGNGIFFPFSF